MSLVELQSADHRDLLDIIDNLREQGISRYVDLPQIIVVGDQSAGKSSVLEAISKMAFPTKDNLCTRFATELILRRDRTTSIKISIVPGYDRSQEEKEKLAAIKLVNDEPPAAKDKTTDDSETHTKKQTRSMSDVIDLSDVVEKARNAMGISESKVFSSDILRVELSGPTQPHLTLVDLPGLFRAGNRDQSVDDAQIVRSMVHNYMSRERSIIVAVVSAQSDFALQEITELSRTLDPDGRRTLGLITKPDTLDPGSESELFYFNLAKNKDVKFRLGWHILKNRSFATKDHTSAQRDNDEAQFFSTGLWKTMDRRTVGVKTLVPRLSGVLKDQILAQLPGLLVDITIGLAECKEKLKQLGAARRTTEDHRRYLHAIAERFADLVKAATVGQYGDAFFGNALLEVGFNRRLRAVVQQLLVDFSTSIETHGQSKESKSPGYVEHVKQVMRRNKGIELPGTFNPAIIGILFSDTCRPWKGIAVKTKRAALDAATRLVLDVVRHLALSETVDKLSQIVRAGLSKLAKTLDAKVNELFEPYIDGHPITYNHYLTDNIQKLQNARRLRLMQTAVNEWASNMQKAQQPFGGNGFDTKALATTLAQKTQPDMEVFAAEWAIDATQAYYAVAKKTFIDNVSAIAIEACLMRHLQDLFTPQMVNLMSCEELANLAAEGEHAADDRAQLVEKQAVLKHALSSLHKLDKHKTFFGIVDDEQPYDENADADADKITV